MSRRKGGGRFPTLCPGGWGEGVRFPGLMSTRKGEGVGSQPNVQEEGGGRFPT